MMGRVKTLRVDIASRYRNHPRIYSAIAIGVLIAIGILLVPREVTFAYSQRTCFYQPAIAPNLLHFDSDTFKMEPDQKFEIGEMTIASLKMCLVPVSAPVPGVKSGALQLAALPFLHKKYAVVVKEPPTAAGLSTRPISVIRNISIPLSEPDSVFDYELANDRGIHADCGLKGMLLDCDIPSLGLKQGSEYTLKLKRSFNREGVSTVKEYAVKTLASTSIIGSTVANGQVIYDRPTGVVLDTDKEIASVSAKIERINGDKNQPVPINVSYDKQKLTLNWKEELPRSAKYALTVDKLQGVDGSSIDGSYVVRFEASGGPRVQGINIGTYGVQSGTRAAITFDQPLLQPQDIAAAITATGGAVVTGVENNKAYITLSGVPRCGTVTITVNDTLQSNHGITGGSGWKYTTRLQCRVTTSIGVSVKGRQITAHTFGNGTYAVVYTGAIHGNESSTLSLMNRWIDELEASPASIPANATVVIIPSINPDGVAGATRTNARNVDLNRNFATNDWKKDITTVSNAPFPGGGGQTPLSEPESQAIASYISRLRPRLVLSYHSIGGLLAANGIGDSSARATTYASLSGYSNTGNAPGTFEYDVSGTADDYYGQVLGVPSILIELGSHTYHQFERNQKAMWAMLR
jgi:predicted deacylase